MRLLVTYATKHGGTAEIAEVIGQRLRDRGHKVDVRPAKDVIHIAGYEAVIVGSAMYMFHWQRDALSLIKRHEAELRQRPTWLFSSGPTGGSPQADATLDEVRRSPTDYPPLGTVAELAERIGARGHATFPGRIEEGVGGIFSRWVPKGDWRDFDAIRDWADAIAADLEVGALVAR
jgi:menaquinone-dependent protoporphyrinogen oxidase